MISIILPVFNGQNYLQECINSILQQDFKEFELIIINDGSHDLSEQIILNISDSRIKYFFKINSGLADTLNFGVSKSKFDYICRIDQDDIMRHDRLTKQLEFLQNNPNKMYNNLKSVNYLEIIPLLVHKIQLMQKEINELKSKLN